MRRTRRNKAVRLRGRQAVGNGSSAPLVGVQMGPHFVDEIPGLLIGGELVGLFEVNEGGFVMPSLCECEAEATMEIGILAMERQEAPEDLDRLVKFLRLQQIES